MGKDTSQPDPAWLCSGRVSHRVKVPGASTVCGVVGESNKEDHQMEKIRDEAFDLSHLPGQGFQNYCSPRGRLTLPNKECRIIFVPQQVWRLKRHQSDEITEWSIKGPG